MGDRVRPTLISSLDNLTWTLELPLQTLAGTYNLELTDRIADSSGNRLNRTNYSVDRRSPFEESYTGSFVVDATSPADFQSTQNFESGDVANLTHWEFASSPRSSWTVTDQGDPEFGSYHLEVDVRRGEFNSADLLLDLSDPTRRIRSITGLLGEIQGNRKLRNARSE